MEVQISKKKAADLFESGRLDQLEAGSFAALANIEKMSQRTFDEIAEKYVEMNAAHPFRDIEIKYVLKAAMTDKINDREMYMKGIDHSYYYEGYTVYKTDEL